MARRGPTSFRLSEETRALLRRLGERHGLSATAVLELAVRRMALVDLRDGGMPPSALLDLAAALLAGKAPP